MLVHQELVEDVFEHGIARIHPQLGVEGPADVFHGSKCGDHQRQGRRDLMGPVLVLPARAHGHRVLADRDADPERRAEFHAECLDGVVEHGVLTGMTSRRHPVGRQDDPREFPTSADMRFVRASDTASLALAGPDSSATGGRSPMAMASPVNPV